MAWALDTSVLIAALVTSHERHGDALSLLLRGEREGIDIFVCAHALAETFSVLTRLPLDPSISASEAEALVTREVADRYRLVPVTSELLRAAIAAVVAAGRRGGAVHDALHVESARQAGVDAVWTLNRKHFLPFWDAAHVRDVPRVPSEAPSRG